VHRESPNRLLVSSTNLPCGGSYKPTFKSQRQTKSWWDYSGESTTIDIGWSLERETSDEDHHMPTGYTFLIQPDDSKSEGEKNFSSRTD